MSSFAELIDQAVTGDGDIVAAVRRAYFYDFDGYPTRLWNGIGVLVAGGQEWIGTLGPDGTDYHVVPDVTDPRDGSNPEYQFGLPYIDRVTFDNLRADKALARGRTLTCFRAIILPGEGLRPATALRFAWSMVMTDTRFGKRRDGTPGESAEVYSASVIARSSELGRSRRPGGTYTYTAQQERARLLGAEPDSFCVFVASNSVRTLTIAGG